MPVTIDTPADASVYAADATISIQATVTPPEGRTVTKVTAQIDRGSGWEDWVQLADPEADGVWTGEATLEANVPPPDVAPIITSFSATNPADSTILILFDSNEALSAIEVTIHKGETLIDTLTEADFTALDGTYSAEWEAPESGTYTVTLVTAEDEGGLNGASESMTVDVVVDQEDSPSSLVNLLAYYPLSEESDGSADVKRLDSHVYGQALVEHNGRIASEVGPRGVRAKFVGADVGLRLEKSGGIESGDNDWCVMGFAEIRSTGNQRLIGVDDNYNGYWLLNFDATAQTLQFRWKKQDATWAVVSANAYKTAKTTLINKDLFVAAHRNRATGDLTISVTDDGVTFYTDTAPGAAPDSIEYVVYDRNRLLTLGREHSSGAALTGAMDRWVVQRAVPTSEQVAWYCNSMMGRAYNEITPVDQTVSADPIPLAFTEQEKYFVTTGYPVAPYDEPFPDWPHVNTTTDATHYPSKHNYWGLNRFYWLRPYRLRDMGPEGAAIADAEGAEYWWAESSDHSYDVGGIYGGFSTSPASLPKSFYYVWDQKTEQVASIEHTETPWLVYNPDDPDAKPFYLYYHAIPSGNYEEQWTYLIKSADLRTWTYVGLQLSSPGGPQSYAQVFRRGSGDWLLINAYRIYTSSALAPASTTDWTLYQDYSISFNWAAPVGHTLSTHGTDAVEIGGKWYQPVLVDNTEIMPNIRGVGLIEVTGPITEFDALPDKLKRVIPGRFWWIEGPTYGVWGDSGNSDDPKKLQSLESYAEDGILYLYPKWGHTDPAHIKLLTAVYDEALANLAVPAGLRLSARNGEIVARVYDALPHQDYTFELAEDAAFTTGLQSVDVTGITHVFSGLTNGTTYYVRARSRHDAQTSGWTIAESAAPFDATATAETFASDHAFEVRIESSHGAVVTLEYGLTAEYGTTIKSVEGHVTTNVLDVFGLEPSTTYYYRASVYVEGFEDEIILTGTVTTLAEQDVTSMATTFDAAYSINRKLGPLHDYAFIATDGTTDYQIGWDVDGNVDEAALLAPGVDLWIKTLRSALGDGNDATAPETTRPKIVVSGAVKKWGAVPIADLTGALLSFNGGTSHYSRTILLASGVINPPYGERYWINLRDGSYNHLLVTNSLETGKPKYMGQLFGKDQSGMHVLSVRLTSTSQAEVRMDATPPVAADPYDTSTNIVVINGKYSNQPAGSEAAPIRVGDIVVIRGDSKAEEAAVRLHLMNKYGLT